MVVRRTDLSVTRYIAALPKGLDSFPGCRTKFSLLYASLKAQPIDLAHPGTHARVRQIMIAAPLRSTWIPTTHFAALQLAQWEAYFRHLEPEAYLRHVHQDSMRTYQSMLYRIAFRLLQPRRLLRRLPERWGMFHRGTCLETMGEVGPDSVTLSLSHPEGLYTWLLLDAMAAGFAAAIETAGGKDAQCDWTPSVGETYFKLKWS